MKIVEVCDVISAGPFAKSQDWKRSCQNVAQAVNVTDWPHGSGKFTIYPESGKKRGKGNGVLPIKRPCIEALHSEGWIPEDLPAGAQGVLQVGDLDAVLATESGYVGFEWETGNISSSHRAINKLVLSLFTGDLVGGILVVPSAKLKEYLTDRIGNITELRPYFRLWSNVPILNGALRIVVVEHDAESLDVPKIPKMTAGRALG